MSLPTTQEEWTDQAQAAGVHNRSLKSCSTLQSGSRVNDQQFLLCRTIVPDVQPINQLDTSRYGLQGHMQQASQILNNPEFNRYLMAIQSKNWVSLHDFRSVLRTQLEVLAGQQQTHPLKRINETTVNTSLILLLIAIGSMHPPLTREWRSSRITLTANFGTVNSNSNPHRQYMAVTDGQLQDTVTGKIICLLECKREERERHSPQVEKQEVAQMVAWVKEYPDPTTATFNRQ